MFVATPKKVSTCRGGIDLILHNVGQAGSRGVSEVFGFVESAPTCKYL